MLLNVAEESVPVTQAPKEGLENSLQRIACEKVEHHYYNISIMLKAKFQYKILCIHIIKANIFNQTNHLRKYSPFLCNKTFSANIKI